MPEPESLSRRERQVMDALFELEEASAKEIQARIPDPPSYSSVRTVLTRLLEKGEIKYRETGLRYVYRPSEPRTKVRQKVLRKTIDTFFGGSPMHMMHSLIDVSKEKLSTAELDELSKLIDEARKSRS